MGGHGVGSEFWLITTVVLTGVTVAGLVGSPPEHVRRVARSIGVDAALAPVISWPEPIERVMSVLRPRQEAPPAIQRIAAGLAAGAASAMVAGRLAPRLDGSWLVAVPVAVVVIIFLGRVERPAVRRRREQATEDLPHVLELLAAAMAAGLPLRGAVREVAAVCEGPVAEDLSEVIRSIDLGAGESDAWRSLRDHPVLGRISVDLARSVDSGTMIAATLRRHAAIARRDRRGALEARARTVGVKSVPPLMVCFVPAFFLICVVPSVVTAVQHAF